MNFKGLVALSSSLFLLAACSTTDSVEQGSESEQTSLESANESSIVESMSSVESSSRVESESSEESSSIEESLSSVVSDSGDHIMQGLMEEKDFSNEEGYKAWIDYTAVVKEYTLGDYLTDEAVEGSTPEEIDALMDKDIERAEVEVSDNQMLVLYRYPDKEGGEFSEVSEFLAEITFYFVNNHLVFSSVTPGYFSVDISNAPEMDVLGNLFTVGELEEVNPDVFTVSEVLFSGERLRQVMVPAQPLPDETDVVLNAFYFFIMGDEIQNFAYLPFNEVSEDFPTNSILLFNSYFNEIMAQ